MKRLQLLYRNRSVSLSIFIDGKTFGAIEPRVIIVKYGQPTRIVRGDEALDILRQIKEDIPVSWGGEA